MAASHFNSFLRSPPMGKVTIAGYYSPPGSINSMFCTNAHNLAPQNIFVSVSNAFLLLILTILFKSEAGNLTPGPQ